MLAFEAVSYSYRDKRALEDVSFSAQPGVTGLLGVNGAGKSTALRIAAGELRPDVGKVINTIGSSTEQNVIGYCPQSVVFPKNLSVYALLEYLAWLRKLPSSTRDNAVGQVLDWSDLQSRKHDKIGGLSGGMLRRLSIAQAMLGSPTLLLLDEPTTGLDPEQRVRIRELLQSMSGEMTVILSSHIVEDIDALAITTLILSDGRMVREVPEAELRGSGQTLEQIFLTTISSASR